MLFESYYFMNIYSNFYDYYYYSSAISCPISMWWIFLLHVLEQWWVLNWCSKVGQGLFSLIAIYVFHWKLLSLLLDISLLQVGIELGTSDWNAIALTNYPRKSHIIKMNYKFIYYKTIFTRSSEISL